MSVSVHVDDREVMAAFDRMAKAGGDMRPIFRQVREEMKADVKAHFKARSGPDGPWAPADPDYIARRVPARGNTYKRGHRKGSLTRKGHKRLAALGGLGRLASLSAYVFEMTRSAVTMALRPSVERLSVHHFGGVVGKGSRIAARPFLWASEKLQTQFVALVEKRLVEAWG